MSEREKIVSGIEAEGLVAIVRVRRPELTLPLAKALVAGGIRAVELTMSIPNALEAVRTIDRELGDKILLGVGTVIDDIPVSSHSRFPSRSYERTLSVPVVTISVRCSFSQM